MFFVLIAGFSVSAFYTCRFNVLVILNIKRINAIARRDGKKRVCLLWQTSSLYSPEVSCSLGDSADWCKAVTSCQRLREQKRAYLFKAFLPMLLAGSVFLALAWL